MSNDISKVFRVFRKNYEVVPLERYKDNPFETLVSTILSSRTRDEVTLEASKRFFKKAPNFETMKLLSYEAVKKLIYPVGFYKTKAKHLKELAEIIIEKYSGEVPNSREELMKLPGVGRKTANLVLNRAFGKPAIAVDTHVHRISNLLGWVDTNKPEKTEMKLNGLLPKKYWSEVNRLFVSIGRQYPNNKKLSSFLESNNIKVNEV